MMTETFSRLPSVDKLLAQPQAVTLVAAYGHALTVDGLRAALDDARQVIRSGGDALEADALVELAGGRLREWTTPRPHPVINATGVIIHTNLGRAPLSEKALAAINAAALSYSDLEYDLDTGERGHRMMAVEDLMIRNLDPSLSCIFTSVDTAGRGSRRSRICDGIDLVRGGRLKIDVSDH